MKYRITVKCCHKTYKMELTIFDEEEFDEDSLVKFLLTGIEHYKEEDGLEGMPHEIIRSEISIDGEDWFLSDRFFGSK